MDSVQWTMLGIVAVLFFWMLGAYNRLQRLRNEIGKAAQQIEEAVQRRDELIGGLLALLRPVASHAVDATSLRAVDEASSAILAASEILRNKPTDAQTPMRVAVAEVGLQAALSAVIAEVERDPALRLSPGMLERLAGISEAERKMRFGRQLYNEAVKVYNAALQQWPTRLLRRLFDLSEAATI
ncbi:MAG: LemA family protein [Betaproteobacteria bacterium]|jgi:LemA protein